VGKCSEDFFIESAVALSPSRILIANRATWVKSRIVPISIDPVLLEEIDQFAKSAGVTRSRLIAEGLRLRMHSESKGKAPQVRSAV